MRQPNIATLALLTLCAHLPAACDSAHYELRPVRPQLRADDDSHELRAYPRAALGHEDYASFADTALRAAVAPDARTAAEEIVGAECEPEELRLITSSLAFALSYRATTDELPEIETLTAYAATHHFNALLQESMSRGAPFESAYHELGQQFPDDLVPPYHFDPEEYLGLGEEGLHPPDLLGEQFLDVVIYLGDVVDEMDALLDQMQEILEAGTLGGWDNAEFGAAIFKGAAMGATAGAIGGSFAGGVGAGPGALTGGIAGAGAGAAGYTANQLYWALVDSFARWGDADMDGTPNWLDEDMDGDGLDNDEDPDRDGDGKNNDDDRAPNNPNRSISACHEYPYTCFGSAEQPEHIAAWLELIDPENFGTVAEAPEILDDYVAFTWE